MKHVSQIAQVVILAALIGAAGLMMAGYLEMPKNAETREAVLAIGGILIAILDPRSLQRKEKEDGI